MSKIKGIIYGPPKIGKTSLIKSLPMDDAVLINIETGDLAVDDWVAEGGKIIRIKKWEEARALTSYIGGIDPNADENCDKPYSKPYYDKILPYCKKHFDIDPIKHKTLIIDSISIASLFCKSWAEKQPEAFTATGKLDNRKIYALIASEMVAWFWRFQHQNDYNVWLICQMGSKEISEGNLEPSIILEGGQSAIKLPFIFDEILAMHYLKVLDDGKEVIKKVFISNENNIWGYKVGDRSGRLAPIEPANLGYIMNKIQTGKRKPTIFDDQPIEMDKILY